MATLPEQYTAAWNADVDPSAIPGLAAALEEYAHFGRGPLNFYEHDAFVDGWQARGIFDGSATHTEWAACTCGDGTPESSPTHALIDMPVQWTRDAVTAHAGVVLARAQGAPHAHLLSRTIHDV